MGLSVILYKLGEKNSNTKNHNRIKENPSLNKIQPQNWYHIYIYIYICILNNKYTQIINISTLPGK